MATFENDLNSEFKRYATFSGLHCPAGVWPLQLAQAGFFRSVADDKVVCFACGLKVDINTFRRESVMDVHRRLAPNCSFVSGSSDNQPVPSIDTHGFPGMDWITQNFVFSASALDRDSPQFFSLPANGLDSDVAEDGAPEEATSASLPALNLAESDLVPVLPILSDLNTLEQTDSQMDSVGDLVDGFANTNLQSISSSALFQHMDPVSQPFGSVLGLGSAGDTVTDADSTGIQGEFPPSLMQDSQISDYAILPMPPSHPGAGNSLSGLNQPGHQNGVQDSPKQKITYDDLGIVVQRPKRQDMATVSKRLQTFDIESWRTMRTSQTKETLSEAGFYYGGYADLCRCFYCGGGLKSWEKDDEPWVEHARWFKDCPYLKTSKGVDFITAVQSLARTATNSSIKMQDVLEEMKQMTRPRPDILAADDLGCDTTCDDDMDTSVMSQLESENDELKRPEMCKICLGEEVSVLYVPCGHLVTCATCSPTVQACPVCRQQIQGRVRITRGD